MKLRTLAAAAPIAVAALTLTACGVNDADVVSENISTAADNFEIQRRVIFINNVTDTYIQTIEGWCNIVDEPGTQLEVTCKVGNEYKKHFLGLNAVTTYSVEQLESAGVSPDFYRVTFKPSVIIPDVDVK